MQRVIHLLVLIFVGLAACQRGDGDALPVPAQEIALTESLRPVYLSSTATDNQLQVVISPSGPVVCCCAPCPQPTYPLTASYAIQVADTEAGPFRTYTSISVGRTEREQYASHTFTLPANLAQKPVIVRVVAVSEKGKAGYVQAIMNSTSPIQSAISEVLPSEQDPTLSVSFNSTLSQVAYSTYVQDASHRILPTLRLADYNQGTLTNVRTLTPAGYTGTFSPDGRQLAYFLPAQTNDEARTLIIYSISTNTPRMYQIPGDLWVGSINWTVDGEFLILLEQNNTYSRLWRMSLADGSRTPLTSRQPLAETGSIWQSSIDLSPDGRSIAVARRLSTNGTATRIAISLLSSTDGRVQSDLETLPGWADKNPAFSPNGQQLAFISSRANNVSNFYTLWVRELSTKQLRHIRLPDTFRLSDFTPRWVGDNKLLIRAYSNNTVRTRAYLVTL